MNGEFPVFLEVATEEGFGAIDQEIAEPEELYFLCGEDAGAGETDVIEFAAFGNPAVEERVGEHGETGFAPENGEQSKDYNRREPP